MISRTLAIQTRLASSLVILFCPKVFQNLLNGQAVRRAHWLDSDHQTQASTQKQKASRNVCPIVPHYVAKYSFRLHSLQFHLVLSQFRGEFTQVLSGLPLFLLRHLRDKCTGALNNATVRFDERGLTLYEFGLLSRPQKSVSYWNHEQQQATNNKQPMY